MGKIIDDYYEDPITQQSYRERVETVISEMKRIYGNSVKLDVHLPMIRELAQSEIACRRYSKLIANDRESETTANLLKNERMQMNRLREQLGISMSKVEKSVQDRGRDNTDELGDIMDDMFKDDIKNGEIDMDEIKKEIDNDTN